MVKIKSKKRKWIPSLLLGVFTVGVVVAVGVAVNEVVLSTDVAYADVMTVGPRANYANDAAFADAQNVVSDHNQAHAAAARAAQDKMDADAAAAKAAAAEGGGGQTQKATSEGDLSFGTFLDVLTGEGGGVAKALATLFSMVLSTFIQFIGWFLNYLVGILGFVASYSGFADQDQVVIGWKIVRDVINSFFIVVLIAIAISTIIRVKSFDFRTTLPKLLIAAILVNFSRTICLLAINFSTSVMKTFTDQLTDAWPALLLGLRAPAVITAKAVEAGQTGGADFSVLLISQLFGSLIIVLACSAILFYVVILVYRIVILWILMILSPLAFFLWGVPGKANSYWNDWLGEFVKALIVGPVLAFFLYIIILFFVNNSDATATQMYGFDVSKIPGGDAPLMTAIGSKEVLFGYIIGIALMFAGLEVANKLGARGTAFAQRVAKAPLKGLVKVGKTVGAYGRDKAYSGLARTRGLRYLAPLVKPGYTIGKIGAGLAAGQKKSIETADAAMASSARTAARKGGVLRSAWLGVGSEEMWQNQGVTGVAGKAIFGQARELVGKDMGARFKASFLNNAKRLSRIDNREKLRKAGKKLDPSMSGQNIGALNKQAENFKIGGRAADLIPKLTSGTATKAEQDEYNKLEKKHGASDLGLLASSYNTTPADERKRVTDLSNMLVADGVKAKPNQTVAAYLTGLENSKGADAKDKAVTSKIQSGREAHGQTVYSAARAQFDKRMNDYKKTAYDPEQEYDPNEVYARASSHLGAGDISEFAADLSVAAKQGGGDIQKVLDNLGEDFGTSFSMDRGGMDNFAGWLQKSPMKATEDEAMNIINKIQRENKDDGRHAQAGFIKRTAAGRQEIVSQDEHDDKVYKSIKGKTIGKIITGSKLEAFGVVKDGKVPKPSEGAVRAMKEITEPQWDKLLSKFGAEISKNMLEHLVDKASDYDIPPTSLATIRGLAIK